MGRAEGLARLHRFAVDLLDHDDDVARPLAAPGLVDDRRLERQPRQPGAILARLRAAHAIGADEMWRHGLLGVAAVAVFLVGRKRDEELAGRDPQPLRFIQIAEIDLAERISLHVADATGRVIAEEHLL